MELDKLSTPQLVARLAQDAQNLLKAEIELGKSELRSAVSSARQGVTRMALGVVLGFLAANVFVAGTVLALAQVIPAWAAAFSVGAALALGSVVTIHLGRSARRETGNHSPE